MRFLMLALALSAYADFPKPEGAGKNFGDTTHFKARDNTVTLTNPKYLGQGWTGASVTYTETSVSPQTVVPDGTPSNVPGSGPQSGSSISGTTQR